MSPLSIIRISVLSLGGKGAGEDWNKEINELQHEFVECTTLFIMGVLSITFEM